MMSLPFGLFTQVSGSGPLGPLVILVPSVTTNIEMTLAYDWITHGR